MHSSPPVRLTPAAAEQLLGGGDGPADLRRVLAAAAGPGTARELAGEAAAVAAFVDARLTAPCPGDPSRRPSVHRTALSKILAAKALAAIVLLAGAGGGVALAANATRAPADPPAATAHPTAAARPSASAEIDPQEDTGRPADAGANEQPAGAVPGTPDPALAGLCHAWATGATGNPGSAAENSAFAALIAAAGSTEQVPSYCAELREDAPPGHSGTAPGRSSTAPGHSGTAPGRVDQPSEAEAPGQAVRPAAPTTGAPDEAGDKAGHQAGHRVGDSAGDKAGWPTEAQKPTDEVPDGPEGDDAPTEDEEAPRR